MNKIISAVLFLFLLAQVVPASEIRALIGINSSKYLFSGEIDSLNRQQKIGGGVGLGWAFNLNQKMKLEVNALYSQKGANVSIEFTPDKTVSGYYKNTSIGFPFFFKYQFKEKASPYVALGPEFVFITAHHLIFPESKGDFDLLDITKKFVLGFNALVGYELPIGQWGLFAEVRYSRWLSNFIIDPLASVKSESFVFLLGGIYYL
jgi:opacity protein-like surface antigen